MDVVDTIGAENKNRRLKQEKHELVVVTVDK